MIKSLNRVTSKKSVIFPNSGKSKLVGNDKDSDKKINTNSNLRSSLGFEPKIEVSNFCNSKTPQQDEDPKNLRCSNKIKFKEEIQEDEIINYENTEKKKTKTYSNSKIKILNKLYYH